MIRIKPIRGKNPFPTRAEWIKAINAGLDESAKEAIRLLDKTTTTWKVRPVFEVQQGSNQYQRVVGTKSKVWNMLNIGTNPHVIRIRNAKRLRFFTGGTAKTKPGRLQSFAGSPGTTPVFAIEVHHPGTEAREWTEAAAKQMRPIAQRNMKDSFRRALRKSK